MHVNVFRNYLVDTLGEHRKMHLLKVPEEIDSLLYSCLPLFSAYQLEERMRLILNMLEGITDAVKERVLDLMNRYYHGLGSHDVFGAKQLREIALILILQALGRTRTSMPLFGQVVSAMRTLEYAIPEPVIVGDSNWIKDYFAFLINPGTGAWEFWRTDIHGTKGFPMTVWDEWMNGSKREPSWDYM